MTSTQAQAQAQPQIYTESWKVAIKQVNKLLASGQSSKWTPNTLHKNCTSKFDADSGWCGTQNHAVAQLLRLVSYLKCNGELRPPKLALGGFEQLNMLSGCVHKTYKSKVGLRPKGLKKVALRKPYKAGDSEGEDAKIVRAAIACVEDHIDTHGWNPQSSKKSSAPPSSNEQQQQVEKKVDTASTTKPHQKSDTRSSPTPATSTIVTMSFNDNSGSFMTQHVQYSDVLPRMAARNSSPLATLNPNLWNTAVITLQGEKEPVIVHKYKPAATKQEPRDDLIVPLHDEPRPPSLPILSNMSFGQWKQQTPRYLHVQSAAKTVVTKQDPLPLIAPRRPQDELDFGDRIDQALLKIDRWAEIWLSGKYKDHTQEEQDLAWQSFEFCLRMPDILDADMRDVEDVGKTVVQIKQEEDTTELIM